MVQSTQSHKRFVNLVQYGTICTTIQTIRKSGKIRLNLNNHMVPSCYVDSNLLGPVLIL